MLMTWKSANTTYPFIVSAMNLYLDPNRLQICRSANRQFKRSTDTFALLLIYDLVPLHIYDGEQDAIPS